MNRDQRLERERMKNPERERTRSNRRRKEIGEKMKRERKKERRESLVYKRKGGTMLGQRVLRRVWHTYRADHAVFLRAEPVRVNALDGVMEYYTLW